MRIDGDFCCEGGAAVGWPVSEAESARYREIVKEEFLMRKAKKNVSRYVLAVLTVFFITVLPTLGLAEEIVYPNTTDPTVKPNHAPIWLAQIVKVIVDTLEGGDDAKFTRSLYPGMNSESEKDMPKGNTVTLNVLKDKDDKLDLVVGGYAEKADVSEVNDNHVTITSGAVTYAVFGGVAKSKNATKNSVTIKGGEIGKAKKNRGLVYGGYVSGDMTAEENFVDIKGGQIYGVTYGGLVDGEGVASKNRIIVTGGTFQYGFTGGQVQSGTAEWNTVNINGGTGGIEVNPFKDEKTWRIFGGKAISGSSLSNDVTISGTFTVTDGSKLAIYGGEADTGGAGSWNTVLIDGAKINGGAEELRIVGGAGSTAANSNIVKITGAPKIARADLIGGENASGKDNTLVIETTGPLTVHSVTRFQAFDFNVPDNFGEGTLLSPNKAVDLSEFAATAFTVRNLAARTKVTLIDAVEGYMTGTGNGYAYGSSTIKLSIEDKKLVAFNEAWPSDPGTPGDGDEPPGEPHVSVVVKDDGSIVSIKVEGEEIIITYADGGVEKHSTLTRHVKVELASDRFTVPDAVKRGGILAIAANGELMPHGSTLSVLAKLVEAPARGAVGDETLLTGSVSNRDGRSIMYVPLETLAPGKYYMSYTSASPDDNPYYSGVLASSVTVIDSSGGGSDGPEPVEPGRKGSGGGCDAGALGLVGLVIGSLAVATGKKRA
jgi:hypothetical protein